MDNQETKTIEECELIAKFMGYEVINYQRGNYKPIYNGHKIYKTIGELRQLWQGLDLQFTGRFTEFVKYPFSDNWNYLMPIVNEIENKGASLLIGRMFCEIKYTNPLNAKIHFDVRIASGVKINAVYGAVIEFIKWYNEQQELKSFN